MADEDRGFSPEYPVGIGLSIPGAGPTPSENLTASTQPTRPLSDIARIESIEGQIRKEIDKYGTNKPKRITFKARIERDQSSQD
jgi:hypothetical protein